MRYGQKVKVQEAFEIKNVKRVISTDLANIYVCREDEYRQAEAEKREPVTIGFPRQFVLEVFDEGR
jgi:hypothetical protein